MDPIISLKKTEGKGWYFYYFGFCFGVHGAICLLCIDLLTILTHLLPDLFFSSATLIWKYAWGLSFYSDLPSLWYSLITYALERWKHVEKKILQILQLKSLVDQARLVMLFDEYPSRNAWDLAEQSWMASKKWSEVNFVLKRIILKTTNLFLQSAWH